MRAPKSGNSKPVVLPEPQTTPCRCFGVVDIGTVDNTYPGRTPTKDRKIMIMFELPLLMAVFNEDAGEQPFALFEEMKFSLHPDSNFSKLISAWRNKPITEEERETFDPIQMINKVGLASIQHKTKVKFREKQLKEITNENTNLVLNAISKLPVQMKDSTPKRMNDIIMWDWDKYIRHDEYGNILGPTTTPFEKDLFDKIYLFLRTKIYTSDEFKACPTAVNIDNETPTADTSSSYESDNEQAVGDDWE